MACVLFGSMGGVICHPIDTVLAYHGIYLADKSWYFLLFFFVIIFFENGSFRNEDLF